MAGIENFNMEIDDLEVFQPEDSHNVHDPPQNVDLAVPGPSGLGSSGTNNHHGRAHESPDRQLTRTRQEEGSSDTEMDVGAGEDGEEDDDDVDEILTFDEAVKEILINLDAFIETTNMRIQLVQAKAEALDLKLECKMREARNRELLEELRQLIEQGLEQVLGEQEE